jgi:type IV pilus assembly protein PilE
MNTPTLNLPLSKAVRRHAAERRKRMLGVTLLELMAVVMVIGILSIVAMPAYRNYAMRAQRIDAKNALLRLATNQERFYLQNRRYGGTADLADPLLGFNPPNSEKGAYAITVPVANNNTFTATATVRAGGVIDQTRDTECVSFSITAQGVRTAAPDPNQRCW